MRSWFFFSFLNGLAQNNSIDLRPIYQANQMQLLENQAFAIIYDYTYSLNLLYDSTHQASRWNLESLFFNSPQAEVYNDIFPNLLREKFSAQDFHQLIQIWFAKEKIWFEVSNLELTKLYEQDDQIWAEVIALRTVFLPQRTYPIKNSLIFLIQLPTLNVQLNSAKIQVIQLSPEK